MSCYHDSGSIVSFLCGLTVVECGEQTYRSRKHSKYRNVVTGTMTLSSFQRTAFSSSSVQVNPSTESLALLAATCSSSMKPSLAFVWVKIWNSLTKNLLCHCMVRSGLLISFMERVDWFHGRHPEGRAKANSLFQSENSA